MRLYPGTIGIGDAYSTLHGSKLNDIEYPVNWLTDHRPTDHWLTDPLE